MGTKMIEEALFKEAVREGFLYKRAAERLAGEVYRMCVNDLNGDGICYHCPYETKSWGDDCPNSAQDWLTWALKEGGDDGDE